MSSDTLDNWVEWHRVCNLSKCSADAGKNLLNYGKKVFNDEAKIQFFGAKNAAERLHEPLPGDGRFAGSKNEECWQYIEYYLLNKTVQGGTKSAKAYICDHVAKQPAHTQHRSFRAGFHRLCRNVVREFYAEELKDMKLRQAEHLVSLDEAVGEEADTSLGEMIGTDDLAIHLPLGELIQSEIDEFTQISEELAPAIWQDMTRRERYVLWAAVNGLPITSDWLQERLGVKKSQLSQARKDFSARITGMLNKTNITGDEYAVHVLKQFIAAALEPFFSEWEKSENITQAYFNRADGEKE